MKREHTCLSLIDLPSSHWNGTGDISIFVNALGSG